MRNRFIIPILLGLYLIAGEAGACECDEFSCDMAERTLVSGRVVKIVMHDGRVLKKGDDFMNSADFLFWFGVREHVADFEVLNSDDTTLIGKTIRIKAGGGTSCDAAISYGLAHFDLYQVRNDSAKLMASVGSCTPMKYLSDIKALEAHFSKRLEVKERCKAELVRRDSIRAFDEEEKRRLAFTPVVRLGGYQQSRDSIAALRDIINDDLERLFSVKSDRRIKIYVTIKVLPKGEVYDVEIVKGEKALEPNYGLMIEEIKKYGFPQIESVEREGFESYRITLPLTFEKTD